VVRRINSVLDRFLEPGADRHLEGGVWAFSGQSASSGDWPLALNRQDGRFMCHGRLSEGCLEFFNLISGPKCRHFWAPGPPPASGVPDTLAKPRDPGFEVTKATILKGDDTLEPLGPGQKYAGDCRPLGASCQEINNLRQVASSAILCYPEKSFLRSRHKPGAGRASGCLLLGEQVLFATPP
jgi:hypothetical protein